MTDNNDVTWPNKRMRTAFWWLFVTVAIFNAGFLRPLYLPDSGFDETRHILLASRLKCDDDGACGAIPDRWRNKVTGQTFTHREEVLRWTAIVFAYGQ
jgi:hypothetical protein